MLFTPNQGTSMPDIECFHVSSETYQPGEIVRLREKSRFIERQSRDKIFALLEQSLERGRPAHASSRAHSLFAYPEIGACAAFWMTEVNYVGKIPIYYRVLMVNPTAVPSRLVSHISFLQQKGKPNGDAVIEHWEPQMNWKCKEFLAPEMTILEAG